MFLKYLSLRFRLSLVCLTYYTHPVGMTRADSTLLLSLPQNKTDKDVERSVIVQEESKHCFFQWHLFQGEGNLDI